MNILEFNKTPYENGFESGRYYSSLIKSKISYYEEKLEDKSIKDSCSLMLTKLKNEYPLYYDEVRGKADGANVSLIAFAAMIFPELFNTHSEKCTTITSKKEDGTFILSHNEDDDYMPSNFSLCRIADDNGSYMVTTDNYNMPFGNGFSWNSHGIFKAINYCHDDNIDLSHLPRCFSQRHISDASSIEDLIARCKEIKTASGYHVNAIDINKHVAVSIEVYTDGVDAKYIDKDYIHTNHYIHNDFINEPHEDADGNSLFRYYKATELWRANSTPTLENMQEILSYTDNKKRPYYSILQELGHNVITYYNVTIDTATKKLYIHSYPENEDLIVSL